MSEELEHEIKERLNLKILVRCEKSLSGGCISGGTCYQTDDDRFLFVKTNASRHAAVMFNGEFESLRQINLTKTIKAPTPRHVIHNYDESGKSAIVMEYFDLSTLTDDGASKLGENLAKLHDYNNKLIKFNKRASGWIGRRPPSARAALEVKSQPDESDERGEDGSDEEESNQFTKHSMTLRQSNTRASPEVPQEDPSIEFAEKFLPEPGTEETKDFGFNVPTSCGLIPQINEWTADWVSFYARHRLDKSIRSLLSDHGDRELSELWSHLQLKVDKFFKDFSRDHKIVPALLHGDLWSGNVAQLCDNYEPIIYDPSSFFGHNEYEFGIARMFGGIPKSFEETYFSILPKMKYFEQRNKLYQLFHHLNHWDHFGSGYRSSSLSIMKNLNLLA